MRISLAGPSYTSASVNAACQQTMNLVPEVIEVGNEPVKMVHYGRPGIKLFATLTPTQIRAMWAGGGRLFVVNGDKLTEVSSSGVATPRAGTVATLGGAPDPAQIFSNGHQLLIISGHRAYCDNGAGPVVCKFLLEGIGHTVTNVLTRDSGPVFTAAMVGLNITINGHIYTVLSFTDADHLLIDPFAPSETNVPWAIAAGAEVDAITGGFLDGYGVINRVPTPGVDGDPGRNFNISDLNDFTIWPPLQFGVKEGRADYISSILCDHEQLILFGSESTEIWQNVGATIENLFPFQRIPGAFIQEGSVAVYAPCSVGPTFCYLGGGPEGQTRAYRAQGLQPVRISTHAQEHEWNAPAFRVSDAVSYATVNAGHLEWVINFWQQQRTWVYDFTTGLWHERARWDGTTYQRYQPWFHVFVPEWGDGGKHIVGDPSTGKLYEMASAYYDDDGAAISYLRAFPHLINENQYAYHHRLEVLAEMGAFTGSDPVPQLGLDYSDDHGKTFHGGRIVNMSSAGDRLWRAAFRRLGKSRDRVYRVGVVAKTKVALIDTYLEMTQGFA